MTKPARFLARALGLVVVLSLAGCGDGQPTHVAASAPPSTTSTSTTTTAPPTTTTTVPTTTTTEPPPPTTTEPPTTTVEEAPVEKEAPPGDGSIQDIILSAFGWGERAHQALKVAFCESTYNPDEVGGGYYRGLFQIGEHHAEAWAEVTGKSYWKTWMDPVLNARYAAHVVAQDGGWGQWSCKP